MNYAVADLLNSTTAIRDSIVGGDGIDSIVVTGAIASFSGSLARATEVEKLVAAAHADGADSYAHSITLASDAALSGFTTIDLSADVDTSSTAAVTLTSSTNNFTVVGLLAGVNTFTSNAGNNSFTGGSAADEFKFNLGQLDSSDTVAGGTGSDKIWLASSSDSVEDADFANVTSIEKLELTATGSSAVLGTKAAAAGIATVIAGAGSNTITSSYAISVDLNTNAGTTLITGAATGNYTITTTDVTTDTITATGSTGTLHITSANLTSSALALATGSGNVTVVGGDAGDTVTVTGLATAGQTFTGSVSKFDVTASTGAQTIVTGALADTITGGAGADSITADDGINVVKYTSTTFAGMQAEGGDTLVSYSGLDATDTTMLNFASGLLVNGTANKLDAVTSAGVIGANDVVLVASDAIVSTNDMAVASGALAAFNAAYTTQTNLASGDRVLFVGSGTATGTTANSYIWLVSKGDSALAATDFTLVAQAAGIADATVAVFGADAMTIVGLSAAAAANTDIFTIG